MSRFALTGAKLVARNAVLEGHAVLVSGGRIVNVIPEEDMPSGIPHIDLSGGWLLPGFIDTQVNGGGDVLFNENPTVGGVQSIARAHRRFGTTGLLPTLISDDPHVIEAALDAVDQAIEQNTPGVLGIHVEGPHLNPDKRGIHDASKFTLIDDAVIDRLTRPTKGVRLVTIAPELAPRGAIRRLVEGGVVVAAGHSMAGYDRTVAALSEGLSAFTHLFNAMTQLGSREPGMVGAALEDRRSSFGLIVDGWHVHPATMRLALAARGVSGVMLVTDAMPPVGGAAVHFDLMGRSIEVRDGACRGPDGTLAGSALSMIQAVRNAWDWLGHTLTDVSQMASANPASLLGIDREVGTLAEGYRADLVHLDHNRRVVRTWIAGEVSEQGE
jgi:N-acetylglucosamine-6-phosphate deacetylase